MANTSSPESHSFMEGVIARILDTLSREDLQLLLTDVVWEKLVKMTALSREEADAVREALIKLESNSDEEIQMRKRFLNEFPHVKKELQKHIAKLYALAARIDNVHKGCTITNVVASSSSVLSGILSILGIALAPVTAGGSLVLSATGLGLGAAAAVTGVSASIVDCTATLVAKAKSRRLLSSTTKKDVQRNVEEVVTKFISESKACVKAFRGIEKNICAFNAAKSRTALVSIANCCMKGGKISIENSRQVQKAFGGTALAMSKGARLMGAATAGLCALGDVCSLVQNSVHLHKGAKTESAAELRQEAQVLEGKLEELTQVYESLQ